ncbi:S-locus-specific glycoprotein S13 precursor, putative [Ricinus communis]|uniref:Receptor-like serine/threonine-protein kinase n=1 Tax=Ricinus communis TaxID=3988 RepID=B9SIG2_RICCO|nr:S-locus-specific glycoprotein S13 precursor, putative [Ricinus communis]
MCCSQVPKLKAVAVRLLIEILELSLRASCIDHWYSSVPLLSISMDDTSILVIFCSYLLLSITTSTAADTINITQSVTDGETLVSAGESFKLGFFSPGNSRTRYLGIWYNKVSVMTVVWVANRETPLIDSSGVLKITDHRILALLNHNGSKIWSSNVTMAARNPVAQLLDSGNLIVKDEGDDNPENFLWQSFDYPCNTLLPGMKLGRNIATGLDRYISSWKTPSDPSRGNFTYGLDPAGYPEMILRENSIERFRAGPWNGRSYSGTSQLNVNPIFKYEFVINETEIYYDFQLLNSSVLSRMVINENGILQRFIWAERERKWRLYFTIQTDDCDQYALCGAFASCNIKSNSYCSCLNGFVPKFPKEWDQADWSGGCVRKTPLNCSSDGFQKYLAFKLPETRKSWFNRSMNLEDCKNMCVKNCSCTVYANLDIREGESGCLLWFSDVIDTTELDGDGQDIYIRMSASQLGVAHDDDPKIQSKSNVKKQMRIILSSLLSAGMMSLSLAVILYVWRKKQKKEGKAIGILEISANDKGEKEELKLPLFDFGTIACATCNFSDANKLGEGGFGLGNLKDGQEIAVRRLSKNSNQGVDEFMNEVLHIAKLQHRNLVRLLGCCIQSEEKLLIYEFMPNKSLDFFIFDQTKSKLLDWPKRYHIINGIARGLLYLHQDSRLRIIHRDLKAGNILLDYEMNPKISDFGPARCFWGNETEASTDKVVGTHGYMSPEYAIDGLYSMKSDVFSFGVIVLEIVSGKRNRGFYHPEHQLNLLGHAWKLHKDGRSTEMIDGSMINSCNLSEVLRSVHVGLLCVQQSLEDRPSMSAAVYMLSGESALPEPKQPGFFTERDCTEANSSSSIKNFNSSNGLTITLPDAR